VAAPRIGYGLKAAEEKSKPEGLKISLSTLTPIDGNYPTPLPKGGIAQYKEL
jgi:hypothetical protein